MMHPANREADRLRVIIEALAFTEPYMTMEKAVKVIFDIEQKTWELESAVLPKQGFVLPDTEPETVAKFIDLQPDIQALVEHKKINAIKEVRGRCIDPTSVTGAAVGLREAKEGVEHWAQTRPVGAVTASVLSTPALIATAINADGVLCSYGHALGFGAAGHNKITWIKNVRGELSIGLKEAKGGCEQWLSDNGYAV